MSEKIIEFTNKRKEKTKELMHEWQKEQNNFDNVLSQKEMIYNNTGKVTEEDIDEIFDAIEKMNKISEKVHAQMKEMNIDIKKSSK